MGHSFPHPQRLFLVIATTILLVGLGLRCATLPLMLYDFDEGVASIYALQLTQRGDWPLYGVKTSLGFYNPPLFIYLVSPAFLVMTSPVVAVGWLQVLGMAAGGWLVAQLYRRGWGSGLLAVALLLALAPGPFFLCRRLWGHALIPAFSCALVAALLICHRREHSRAAIAIPLLIGGAQQVHFSGALLGLDFLFVALCFKLKLNWRWFLAGIALALATYTPYLLHQSRTGHQDLRTITDIIFGGAAGQKDATPLWLAFLHSLSDFGGGTAFQQNYPRFLQQAAPFVLIRWALALAWVTVLGWSLVQLRPGRRTEADPLLIIGLVWTAIPLLTFSILKVVTVPAYWLVALPGPFLLTGAAVENLSRRYRQARITWALAGIVVVAAFSHYFWVHERVVRAADPQLTVYPSYRDQLEAVQFVTRSAPAEGVQLTQEGRAADSGIDYQLLYLLAMLEGNATRFRAQGLAAYARPQYTLHNRAKPLPVNLTASPLAQFGLLEVHSLPPLARHH